VLGGIRGPGADFLSLGAAVTREIATAADRATATRLERETAVMRARGAIARDLHDSVAQSLAGACFRLEALRRAMSDGKAAEPAEEIAAVRDALRSEQAQVRGMIQSLRDRTALLTHTPLAADLERTLADAAAHWHLSASFAADGAVDAGGGLGHELRQLLREAVANAARHGQASHVNASLARVADGFELVVADNGSGFDDPIGAAQPWSISERVAELGGSLSVQTGPGGTRLAITLPLVSSLEQTA
jgi:signal transduction histidine kinase